MKRLHFVLVALAAVAVPLRAEIIQQVLVKVNGEIFTKTDLEERQVQALRQRNRGVNADDLKNDEQLKKALDEITPQIVVDAVDEMLIMQRGRELGIKMSDEQFQSIVQNIRKENNLEDDKTFEAALKQEGMTMADLRKNLEQQMILARVQQQEVWNRIAITEAETKAYYDAHREEFTTPAILTLREILVGVPEERPAGAPAGPGVNVGLDEEAAARADRLRVRAAGGEDFAKLAAAESDAPSKANGGLIGPINESDLAPALQQLLARMKAGEISQPLRTPKGYQILKLESRTQTKVLSFDEARDQISDKVFQQKRRGELQKYIEKLRAEAIIEWKNDDFRKMYEARIAQQPTPPSSGN